MKETKWLFRREEGADVNEAEPHKTYTNNTYERNPQKRPTDRQNNNKKRAQLTIQTWTGRGREWGRASQGPHPPASRCIHRWFPPPSPPPPLPPNFASGAAGARKGRCTSFADDFSFFSPFHPPNLWKQAEPFKMLRKRLHTAAVRVS